MEKYKTLNNCVARNIIRQACAGNYRSVYMLLYNYRDAFVDDVYFRICKIANELAPLTYAIYKTLPCEVQSYLSSLYFKLIHS